MTNRASGNLVRQAARLLLAVSLGILIAAPWMYSRYGTAFAAGNPNAGEDALDTTPEDLSNLNQPYCADEEVWLGGACKSATDVMSEFGLTYSIVDSATVHGVNPLINTLMAPGPQDLAQVKVGALLEVLLQDGSSALLEISDQGNVPVVQQTYEFRTEYVGGWMLQIEAKFERTELVGTVPPLSEDEYVLTGKPTSMFLPGSEPTWWEIRGQGPGGRFFNYGTDHPDFGIAIMEGAAGCEDHGAEMRSQFVLTCKELARVTPSSILSSMSQGTATALAVVGIIGVLVVTVFLVATPLGASLVAAASSVSAAHVGAAVGAAGLGFGVYTHWQSTQQSELAAELDSCDDRADRVQSNAQQECNAMVNMAIEANMAPLTLHLVEPAFDELCPVGTIFYSAGTPITNCFTTEVIIEAWGMEGSRTLECNTIILQTGACVREVSLPPG